MACSIEITLYKQNGASIDPGQVSRQYDLRVEGTASPDTEYVSGRFHFDSDLTGYPLTISRSLTAMDWHTVISKAKFADMDIDYGTVVFVNLCEDAPAEMVTGPLGFLDDGVVAKKKRSVKKKAPAKKKKRSSR